MTAIDHFNLRAFDLNLLLAFDALMMERSVTRAATRLRIGQPAMSHALSNLRMLMDDELFVRAGQLMRPTTRAEAIADGVRDVLAQTQDVLFARQAFDPARAMRQFRIGMSNELELLVLPSLMARLGRDAPGIKILAKTGSRQALRDMLDEGAIDMAVGCLEEPSAWHRHEALYRETHLCCFNPRLLRLSSPVGLADYLRIPHVLMSLKDSLTGCLEQALAKAGATLNTVAAAPHLVALMATVAEAPLLTTLPARLVRSVAPRFKLRVSPVPLPLSDFEVTMFWHSRADRDPGMRWLTRVVGEVTRLG